MSWENDVWNGLAKGLKAEFWEEERELRDSKQGSVILCKV